MEQIVHTIELPEKLNQKIVEARDAAKKQIMEYVEAVEGKMKLEVSSMIQGYLTGQDYPEGEDIASRLVENKVEFYKIQDIEE